MIYLLENDLLRVEISDRGAEMMSLTSKRTGVEYLWQGDELFWDERAPILFPICGRLTGGVYTYEGNTYPMGLHGFARHADFAASEVSEGGVTFTLIPPAGTEASYPFAFAFRVRYELCGATLRQSFEVVNEGEGPLPFSLGAHPGFRVPSADGTEFSDYEIVFADGATPRLLEISPTGFPTGACLPAPVKGGRMALTHELFDGAGLFFSDMGDEVTLRSVRDGRCVRLSFTDMTHLGFWKPDHTVAPFVCIEPWHGLPSTQDVVDDFATKAYMLRLAAGEVYRTHIEYTVED